jgi:hypothetical protein
VAASGTTTTAALTAGCAWSLSSDALWITITSAASSTGNATVSYAVAINTGSARTGHITVTGSGGTAQLTIVQSPATPGAPSGLRATLIGNRVSLAWIAPASGSAPTSYVIEIGSITGVADLAVENTGSTTTTFLSGPVGDESYFIRVKATNSVGTSVASNEVILIVGRGCGSAPGPPSGLAVTASGGLYTLSWTAPRGNPLSYILEAGSVAGATNLINRDLLTPLTSISGGALPGTYHLRLRGRNACGTGPASSEIVVIAS